MSPKWWPAPKEIIGTQLIEVTWDLLSPPRGRQDCLRAWLQAQPASGAKKSRRPVSFEAPFPLRGHTVRDGVRRRPVLGPQRPGGGGQRHVAGAHLPRRPHLPDAPHAAAADAGEGPAHPHHPQRDSGRPLGHGGDVLAGLLTPIWNARPGWRLRLPSWLNCTLSKVAVCLIECIDRSKATSNKRSKLCQRNFLVVSGYCPFRKNHTLTYVHMYTHTRACKLSPFEHPVFPSETQTHPELK